MHNTASIDNFVVLHLSRRYFVDTYGCKYDFVWTSTHVSMYLRVYISVAVIIQNSERKREAVDGVCVP